MPRLCQGAHRGGTGESCGTSLGADRKRAQQRRHAQGMGAAEGEGPGGACPPHALCRGRFRSEEHTSELQSLMRISYAVFCLKKKTSKTTTTQTQYTRQISHKPSTNKYPIYTQYYQEKYQNAYTYKYNAN